MDDNLSTILNNWCEDFVGLSENHDRVPYGLEGKTYSRECMQAYRASLHSWVNTQLIDSFTYFDMKKTCAYLNLTNDTNTVSINVLSTNPINQDLNDERNYEPFPISKSCLESFRYYTHGQDFYNEESFNPGAKVHLTQEFIHLMTIAQKIGVLAVLGPLIASLGHCLGYKMLCTFFQHHIELDISSGTYIEQV